MESSDRASEFATGCRRWPAPRTPRAASPGSCRTVGPRRLRGSAALPPAGPEWLSRSSSIPPRPTALPAAAAATADHRWRRPNTLASRWWNLHGASSDLLLSTSLSGKATSLKTAAHADAANLMIRQTPGRHDKLSQGRDQRRLAGLGIHVARRHDEPSHAHSHKSMSPDIAVSSTLSPNRLWSEVRHPVADGYGPNNGLGTERLRSRQRVRVTLLDHQRQLSIWASCDVRRCATSSAHCALRESRS